MHYTQGHVFLITESADLRRPDLKVPSFIRAAFCLPFYNKKKKKTMDISIPFVQVMFHKDQLVVFLNVALIVFSFTKLVNEKGLLHVNKQHEFQPTKHSF